jgi:hypothetical protein
LASVGRVGRINQTVIDQADFFEVDGFTPIKGLTLVDLTSHTFCNNVPQPWPVMNGAPVSDSQVNAGSLYFHEIPGAPGSYSLRFRPNAAGFWRVRLTYAAGQQIVAQDYDVSEPIQTSGGLTASFNNR